MTPFLYQIASAFYKEYGVKTSRMAFVFPNRRAGLFFQKYLAEVAGKPVFSPAILTISDLFVKLSGKEVSDRIYMLFTLYHIYVRQTGSDESFDDFVYWGEMLLNDFDDIDKHMADARMLFTNVTDLKQLEDDFSYLTPEQVAAIRTFWSSFHPKGDSPNQQSFLAVWEVLYPIYSEFRKELAGRNQGYEGMIFRDLVEEMQETQLWELPWDKVVFVGLNALSKVEEVLLLELQQAELADFYWDYDSRWLRDPENRASYFASRNLKLFPSQLKWDKEELGIPSIEVIGIPSGIGQAKHVYNLLSELCKEEDEEGNIRTAVVLPDESLLVPVLHAIPEHIRRINVTMGYPLSGTPVASLVNYVLALQKNVRYVDRNPYFYYRDVLPVLNHRYISIAAPDVIYTLIQDISENNRIYISPASLAKNELLSLLFTPVTALTDFSSYLIGVLQELNKSLSFLSVQVEDEEYPVRSNDLEQEFLFHYFVTVNRMKEVMEETCIEMKMETYFRLLKRITDSITIPFRGEPLSGLQIMGVLETRTLDFERVIILSMNEGIFPAKKAAGSFIPYNLRRGFGLPTYEHQDSIWAYHFYRLLSRASHISLLYDTRTTGVQTGEVSRYVHQLRYHYEVPLRDKLVIYNVSSSKSPVLEVGKTTEVMEKLACFHQGGERAISASAINTYLDCPLKFYFSVVENIREEEEATETIESNGFGSILHKVMEELYQPFCGKMVTADLLRAIRKDTPTLKMAIARAFTVIFFKKDKEYARPLTGQNFLIGEMIRKYVEKIIDRDCKLTPFRYIMSEKRVSRTIDLANGRTIQVKGFIDRIDEVNGAIRIIDYKSGSGITTFNAIPALFDKEEKERSKAVMQVFMYAWMYGKTETYSKPVQPGIYYMRTLFSDNFNPGIYKKVGRGVQEQIIDFANYYDEFEEGLKNCMSEIFSNEGSFAQTTIGKACAYCTFKQVCGK